MWGIWRFRLVTLRIMALVQFVLGGIFSVHVFVVCVGCGAQRELDRNWKPVGSWDLGKSIILQTKRAGYRFPASIWIPFEQVLFKSGCVCVQRSYKTKRTSLEIFRDEKQWPIFYFFTWNIHLLWFKHKNIFAQLCIWVLVC